LQTNLDYLSTIFIQGEEFITCPLFFIFETIYPVIFHKLIFWAFLLRSRRATGFGAGRTMRASTHALRMPNANTRAYMHYAQGKS